MGEKLELQKQMKFQEKMEEKLEFQKKFSWNSKKWGKKLEFVGFSLSSPVPIDLLINFEKFLRSKETSHQNSKNH